MKNNKSFIIILIIIVVGIAAFFLQKDNASHTFTDLQDYANEEFSISYPKGWYVSQTTFGVGIMSNVDDSYITVEKQDGLAIDEVNKKNCATYTYKLKTDSEKINIKLDLYNVGIKKVDGINACEVVGIADANNSVERYLVYYLISDDNAYLLSATMKGDSNKDFNLDSLLNSFKLNK